MPVLEQPEETRPFMKKVFEVKEKIQSLDGMVDELERKTTIYCRPSSSEQAMKDLAPAPVMSGAVSELDEIGFRIARLQRRIMLINDFIE